MIFEHIGVVDEVTANTLTKEALDGTNNAIQCFKHGRFIDDTAVSFMDQPGSAAPNWGTWAFPDGTVSIAYEHQWDMPDAYSPTTYTVDSGSLPSGLSLTSGPNSQGKISGTPTAAGTYTFTLKAVNVQGSVTKSFSITINAAAVKESSYAYGV